MTTAAETYARALALRAGGDEREAAMAFLMAFAMAPQTPAYRAAAFQVLNVLDGYRTLPPGILEAIHTAVRDPALDLQPLSLVVRNLVEGDPRLPGLQAMLAQGDESIENGLGAAAWLLADRLLVPVLARATNISPVIERIVTVLRRHLCLRVARRQPTVLLDDYRPAVEAMARQCVTNRYAWLESSEEEAMVAGLVARDDADALVVRAAYRPLADIDRRHVHALPPSLAALWHEQDDERERAKALVQLTPLAPGLSGAMRAQYEAHPYPRWRQLHVEGRRSLKTLFEGTMPGVPFADALAKDVDILVAGCGTGLPALTLARAVTGARILAVDISRASLAYAARMAATLGADNVNFAVADILNLGSLGRQFDFIDCSGVLHHMDDPSAGLRVLRGLLRPHGVMTVGLYSERGRKNIAAARDFIRENGFDDTPQGMRAFRATMMALPKSHPAQIESLDFFTLDGLHDLVFNIHETHTSPARMKHLLNACGLAAIGVNVPSMLGGSDFRKEHPDPACWADLDLWDAYEARHPDVFSQMIQVWCRPI